MEISKHREKSWKCNTNKTILDKMRGVRIADETLSWVFDISSRLKQKLKSKRRSKIVKFYANLDWMSSVIFFVLTWWNINEFEKC